MEREVGGGIGMGNTCKPMAVSFQCMTKFTTNKKKIFLKIKKKKCIVKVRRGNNRRKKKKPSKDLLNMVPVTILSNCY